MSLNRPTASPLPFLAGTALTLGLLWWLQGILVPIVLAVLLTFLLSPPIAWLQRQGVPRAVAVVLMLAGTMAIGGTVAWTVALQVNRLVDTFPEYQEHLDAKIAAMHSDGQGFFDKVQRIVGRVSSQLDKVASSSTNERGAAKRQGASPGRPQPVTIVENSGPFHIAVLWKAVHPLLEPLATGSLTLVLVIFMLLRREDLRNRVIAVVGHARLVATTKAFDDAGSRISRYLLRQLMVNSAFGVGLGIGLFFIGLPYAILWGALAAVLRYVPYLGIWLAATLPLALSVLLTDSWQPTLLVAGLFLVLELLTNMIIEPRVYGQGAGVSETGTLVMVSFWTWLWGPVGLLLATPLTVCIVVLGKYMPALRYISMLLGDRPALPSDVNFYQRLLAHDVHEATLIAKQVGAEKPFLDLCDELMLPALGYLSRDLAKGQLDPTEERQVLATCEQVVDTFEASLPEPDAQAGKPAFEPQLVIVPAHDPASGVAAAMLEKLLDAECLAFKSLSSGLLSSQVSQQVVADKPFAVLICVVAEKSLSQVRLLCKRLKAESPDVWLVVGLWTAQTEQDALRERLSSSGADQVVCTFGEALSCLKAFRQLVAAGAPSSL